MRTTLTLDDDVALMLEKIRKVEQKSFKQVVNEVLRRGLVESRATGSRETRFATPELKAGPLLYSDIDDVAEILAVAEGENYQ